MSKFFINRPIFSIVIAIAITLIGVLSMVNLPVAKYPQITPPTVQVRAIYPGATAEIVNNTVASVIENQVIGVQNMDYMVSNSSNNGFYSLSIQFDQGTDADMDTVNVQNRVAAAEAALPSEVKNIGVTTVKSTGDMAFIFSLNSPNGTYNDVFLKNYGSNYLMNAIKSINGVGSVQEFGADYAMRVWLNPSKMALYNITIADITKALQMQNKQAAAGTIGSNPTNGDQQFEYPIKVNGKLQSVEEFGNISLSNINGNVLHLRDVARIELASKSYDFVAQVNNKPVAGFAISLTNDANALETIKEVRKVLEEESKNFPPDLEYNIVVDNTEFVTASIEEVLHTFVEALLLVLLIVYIFLQSWRSTIIPMIAVPVSLLGTFAAFQVLNFSINTLTLFAMVLAIGLVVDDAIVVVEAVEYELKYNGLRPKEAALAAMKNVQGPVIAIAFVLVSVFVPVSFMGGMTGILYKQFALTIAVSVIISAMVALIVTPALCGTMLRPHKLKEKEDIIHRGLQRFNAWIDKFTNWYGFALVKLSKKLWLSILVLVVFVVTSLGALKLTPTAFVPSEDNGFYIVAVNLPDGATNSRTNMTLEKIANFLRSDSDIRTVFAVSGFDLLGGSQKSSAGAIFAALHDWDQRTRMEQQLNTKIRKTFGFAGKEVPEATVLALNPPSIPGLGATGGITMYLINKAGDSTDSMANVAKEFVAAANQDPSIARAFTTFSNTTPTLDFAIDRDKAAHDGVALTDIYTALQGFYGSLQVNDFTEFGKNYKVMLQADQEFRQNTDALHMIYVKNSAGKSVPIANYITKKQSGSAATLTRFDNALAIRINVTPTGSSGNAMAALKAIPLPSGYSISWADQSREESKASTQSAIILGLGLIFVFLILAALYESWKVPFAVLFSVPSGIFGAVVVPMLLNFTGFFLLSNNLYFQIGLLTLVGLAAKNAILIIEYAKIRVDHGMDFVSAAIEASKIRLRPILMTSLAFILGTIPLALSSGAGAASRISMGITVVAGMTTATIFGIFIIPMLFILIEKLGQRND